jgi:hypothetical protein
MNWVFISQKMTFFIVTAIETSNLTTGAKFRDGSRSRKSQGVEK